MNKRFLLSLTLLMAVIIVCYSACQKEYIIDVTSTCANCAQVKFLNGNPTPADSFQLFVNDKKITGTFVGFANLFPGTVEYAAVPSGSITARVEQRVTDSTSTPVATENLTLEAGKRYGIIWTGDTGKDPFVLINNRDLPGDSGYVMVQFVNLIKSDQTVDLVDQATGNVVFSAVPYKGVKDYIKLPAGAKYTIRETETNIPLAVNQPGGSAQTRNYTWYAIGAKYDTLKGSPTRIFLDYYTNGYPKTE